jgi:hypothetical protein
MCTKCCVCGVVMQMEVHREVGDGLRRVLRLVPTAPSALLPLILRRVPHKRLPVQQHQVGLSIQIIDASASFGPGGGSQFAGHPLSVPIVVLL